MNDDNLQDETLAIRTSFPSSFHQEHSEGLFLTSSFLFNSAEQAAKRFSGEEPGNIYSRFTNPTVALFEKRLAALEQGNWGIATASGMAAIMTCLLGLLKAGDHIVASRGIFGTTYVLLAQIFSKFSIEITYVDLTDLAGWEQAIRPNTRLFFLESPSNPLTELVDIAALAKIAHTHHVLLVVDNCFCTPILQKPLELGADVVIHSATKYIDGQGRCLGGAVIGRDETHYKDIFSVLRSGGASLSPFNAWVFLKGLETLSIRMERHCANALEMARWLSVQPEIAQVYYPGLPSHPQHELATRQQKAYGGIISFVVQDQKTAWNLIDRLQLFSITANLGDTKSTVTHPFTTTHGRLTAQEKQASYITDGLIRFSIGLENVEDLKRDVQQALR